MAEWTRAESSFFYVPSTGGGVGFADGTAWQVDGADASPESGGSNSLECANINTLGEGDLAGFTADGSGLTPGRNSRATFWMKMVAAAPGPYVGPAFVHRQAGAPSAGVIVLNGGPGPGFGAKLATLGSLNQEINLLLGTVLDNTWRKFRSTFEEDATGIRLRFEILDTAFTDWVPIFDIVAHDAAGQSLKAVGIVPPSFITFAAQGSPSGHELNIDRVQYQGDTTGFKTLLKSEIRHRAYEIASFNSMEDAATFLKNFNVNDANASTHSFVPTDLPRQSSSNGFQLVPTGIGALSTLIRDSQLYASAASPGNKEREVAEVWFKVPAITSGVEVFRTFVTNATFGQTEYIFKIILTFNAGTTIDLTYEIEKFVTGGVTAGLESVTAGTLPFPDLAQAEHGDWIKARFVMDRRSSTPELWAFAQIEGPVIASGSDGNIFQSTSPDTFTDGAVTDWLALPTPVSAGDTLVIKEPSPAAGSYRITAISGGGNEVLELADGVVSGDFNTSSLVYEIFSPKANFNNVPGYQDLLNGTNVPPQPIVDNGFNGTTDISTNIDNVTAFFRSVGITASSNLATQQWKDYRSLTTNEEKIPDPIAPSRNDLTAFLPIFEGSGEFTENKITNNSWGIGDTSPGSGVWENLGLGPESWALTFNGSSTYITNSGGTPEQFLAPDHTTARTIEMWAYIDNDATINQLTLWSNKRDSVGGVADDGWLLGILNDGVSDKFFWGAYQEAGNRRGHFYLDTILPRGRWFHVIASKGAVDAASDYNLYIDGNFQTPTSTVDTGSFSVQTDQFIRIGVDWANNAPFNFLKGKVAYYATYNYEFPALQETVGRARLFV